MTLYPVIMAGGSGTRLWPLSRERHPKQFFPIVDDETMLQQTARRLDGLRSVERPLVVCNEAHRFFVADQLRAVGVEPLGVIIEPEGRNTAPALTLAALWLLEMGEGHDPVILAMPGDHLGARRRGLPRGRGGWRKPRRRWVAGHVRRGPGRAGDRLRLRQEGRRARRGPPRHPAASPASSRNPTSRPHGPTWTAASTSGTAAYS